MDMSSKTSGSKDLSRGPLIGVLALQGAFIEHIGKLNELGFSTVELRCALDLTSNRLDGLVLPGGESTVQMKLLHELGMFEPLKALIESGVPVLGTCAGLILLASSVEGQSQVGFGTMPVVVRRNAYGRQLGSFHTTAPFEGVGDVPMTFIRAPYVTAVGDGVQVLSKVDGNIVAVRYGSQYGLSFHPELDDGHWVYDLVFGRLR